MSDPSQQQQQPSSSSSNAVFRTARLIIRKKSSSSLNTSTTDATSNSTDPSSSSSITRTTSSPPFQPPLSQSAAPIIRHDDDEQQEEEYRESCEEEFQPESPITTTTIPKTITSPKTIQQLSKSSIHKLCSEQVIISLTSVVKELIENALDAKSTFIEIKFVNMGLESIEVIDNGIGISKNNFNHLVKKHHTSKITSFHDLNGVETFGFRGEVSIYYWNRCDI